MRHDSACPRCGRPAQPEDLAETAWLAEPVRQVLGARGACMECVRQALCDWLQRRIVAGGAEGCSPFNDGCLIPFGIVPVTHLLGHNARFTGHGITLAMIDSGFFPHPELTGQLVRSAEGGRLRVRAWADASARQVRFRYFHPVHVPRWPGWSRRAAEQWHGMMTAAVAAGDGRSSHGWYYGFAPGADLVFVQTWDETGHISNASIVRALRWLFKHRQRLRLRVVNVSVYGDPVKQLRGNYVDAAVRRLVEEGVVVVTAAGNSGRRRLVPPATAESAITVGGFDTRNSPDQSAWRPWLSNWGRSSGGTLKPDLLAPALWVPASILPGSPLEAEARAMFARRADGDSDVEARIAAQKLIGPHHQHVDGSSFAAAIVSGVIACLLEANPKLAPDEVKRILKQTALPLPGAPAARQGAGVIRPAAAIEQVIN